MPRIPILKLVEDVPPEEVEGMWLFNWISEQEIQHPEFKWIAHIPNGGRRDVRTGAKLKAQGVRTGIYDYLWLLPRGGFHGAVMELKKRKGGYLEDSQKNWRDWALQNGYCWQRCNGAEEAKAFFAWYFALSPVPCPACEALLVRAA